jgi:hypothetical protein
MNVGAAFEANTKTTEVMQPRVSSFNHPAEFSQAAAVFGAAPGDDGSDASVAQASSMCFGIVAPIGVYNARLVLRPATHAANRRDRVNQWQKLSDVVALAPVRIALRGTPLASTRM